MKKCINNMDVSNKKVIIRCDLNVPMKDNVISDDTRIIASVKTIKYVIDNGGSAIILSHLGKVVSEEDKNSHSLRSVAVRLSNLLNINVKFCSETRGNILDKMVKELNRGEVILVENTRFEDIDGNKESGCDMELAAYWANLGDIFVNDAYGTCHRSHASNVGIGRLLPNCLGFLVMEEVSKLEGIMSEESHPFVVIMGGAKVSDKIKVIFNLINKCDKLLIGGGMAYTFISAMGYSIGKSLLDSESISFCREMLGKYRDKIVLPCDCLCAKDICDNNYVLRDIKDIRDDEMGLDIGNKTILKYEQILKDAKRVIINGPMGVFENPNYAIGTKSIYDCIIANNIKTLVGGGDSVASVNKLSDASKFYHISTGGGATLEYLEGKILPGIAVINDEERY